MKAEERHELRENDLAGWLQFGLLGFVRQYGSYILLVVALAFLGYTLWQRHVQSLKLEREQAFVSYYDAIKAPAQDQNGNLIPGTGNEELVVKPGDPFKPVEFDNEKSYVALGLLPEMAENGKYPEIKVLAALELAKLYNLIAADPMSLKQQNISRWDALGKAYEYYNKALSMRGDDPMVASKAHLGMAAVYEGRGEWDNAIKEYNAVTSDAKLAGPLADYAKALSDPKKMEIRRSAPQLTTYVPSPSVPKPVVSAPATTTRPNFLDFDTHFDFNKPIGPQLMPSPTPGLTPSLTPSFTPGPQTAPGIRSNLPEQPK